MLADFLSSVLADFLSSVLPDFLSSVAVDLELVSVGCWLGAGLVIDCIASSGCTENNNVRVKRSEV